MLLFDTLNFFRFDVWDYWPLLLVFVGASLISRASKRDRGEQAADSSSNVQSNAILGGIKGTVNSQDFQGGELTAILGGCEIDLREASISEAEAVLDTFALCGGIKLRVPDDWSVIVRGISLLGEFADKTRPPKTAPEKRLIVKGTAIMGGVEISN